jgi:hypothetical protein
MLKTSVAAAVPKVGHHVCGNHETTVLKTDDAALG